MKKGQVRQLAPIKKTPKAKEVVDVIIPKTEARRNGEVFVENRAEKLERPERRGRSKRKVIEAAKEIPAIDLANLLCGPGQMRKSGKEWVGRCPLPDHEDRVASFTVNPEKNLWFCHGCVRGGDVVRLALHAWGYGPGDDAMAAADLLREFGREIPPRPASWHARQERQGPVRDAIEAERIEHIRDLVFRLVWQPWLRLLPDETRHAAATSAWEKSHTLAAMLYERGRIGS